MNKTLTVTDPLAAQDVTLLITLPASDRPRPERPLLLSLGVAAQAPVVKTGVLADLAALITEAWTACGVRMQAAAAVAEEETIAEAAVTAVAAAGEEPAPPTPPLPPPATNLSLF